MWGLLGFLLLDSFVRARRSTVYLSTPNDFTLHEEKELEVIEDGSWIEGNITTISQKDCKKITK
jgi:hypothetical protein